jgi:hypothetical protein
VIDIKCEARLSIWVVSSIFFTNGGKGQSRNLIMYSEVIYEKTERRRVSIARPVGAHNAVPKGKPNSLTQA